MITSAPGAAADAPSPCGGLRETPSRGIPKTAAAALGEYPRLLTHPVSLLLSARRGPEWREGLLSHPVITF